MYLNFSVKFLELSPSNALKLSNPKISLKFVAAIATAIPTVKPTIIELGTSLAYLPTP